MRKKIIILLTMLLIPNVLQAIVGAKVKNETGTNIQVKIDDAKIPGWQKLGKGKEISLETKGYGARALHWIEGDYQYSSQKFNWPELFTIEKRGFYKIITKAAGLFLEKEKILLAKGYKTFKTKTKLLESATNDQLYNAYYVITKTKDNPDLKKYITEKMKTKKLLPAPKHPKYQKEPTKKEMVKPKNVLDICILLDTWDDAHSALKGNLGAIAIDLAAIIKQKEAVIATSQILHAITLAPYSFKNTLHELLNGQWIITRTKNKKFYVLIPKQKYPHIKNKNDLKKIGINNTILDEIFVGKNSPDLLTSVDLLRKELNITKIYKEKDYPYSLKKPIDDNTLKNIFLETTEAKKIMKRIYLDGHGMFDKELLAETKNQMSISPSKKDSAIIGKNIIIASLNTKQYVDFLEKLKKINCSFFFVDSCYSGGLNTLASQMSYISQKNIVKKFKALQLPFILIIGSSPGTVSNVRFDAKYDKLFYELNNFFTKQEEETFKLAAVHFKINGKKEADIKKIIANAKKNTNDIKIMSGQTWKEMFGKKVSLIKRKPWIVSKDLMPIINTTMPGISNSKPSIRFPASSFTRYIKSEQERLVKVIDYKSLLKHQITQRNKPIHFKGGIGTEKIVFTYPSIITIPIKATFLPENLKFISSIPGRAHHYFKEISINECDENPLKFLFNFGLSTQAPKKLFFIKKLIIKDSNDIPKQCLPFKISKPLALENVTIIHYQKENQTSQSVLIHNVIIKHNKIYYNCAIENYKKSSPIIFKKINTYNAIKTIAQEILKTTPIKEALYEASGGMETEKKFIATLPLEIKNEIQKVKK